jgi:hypothetical protein
LYATNVDNLKKSTLIVNDAAYKYSDTWSTIAGLFFPVLMKAVHYQFKLLEQFFQNNMYCNAGSIRIGLFVKFIQPTVEPLRTMTCSL